MRHRHPILACFALLIALSTTVEAASRADGLRVHLTDAVLTQVQDISVLTSLVIDPTTEHLPTCRANAALGLRAHQQEMEKRLMILKLLRDGRVAVAQAEADWSLDPMHVRTLSAWASAVPLTCEKEKKSAHG